MRSERIVIIDDDDDAITHKMIALKHKGFEKIEYYLSPAKFLRKFKTMPAPDLIITDNKMDPITGIELIEQLRSMKVKAPILLVSQDQKPFNYNGPFLQKPAMIEDYISMLADAAEALLSRQ